MSHVNIPGSHSPEKSTRPAASPAKYASQASGASSVDGVSQANHNAASPGDSAAALGRATNNNPADSDLATDDIATSNDQASGRADRVQEPSRVDEAYQQILLRIVRGEVAGGAELKSTLLAQSLGMSRTPVVQALHRLAADGLVNLEANKRAVVRPGAENWLVEIHQMRELLEPFAAAEATHHITDEDLAKLDQLALRARPGDSEDWAEHVQQFDFALHLLIAERSGSFVLAEAIRKCWSFKQLSYIAVPEKPQSLARGYEEHLSLLEALRARDARTAQAAMLFHLRSAATLRPAQTIV